jgi:hypothetical protein
MGDAIRHVKMMTDSNVKFLHMVFPKLGDHLEAFERASLIFTTTHGPNDTLGQISRLSSWDASPPVDTWHLICQRASCVLTHDQIVPVVSGAHFTVLSG